MYQFSFHGFIACLIKHSSFHAGIFAFSYVSHMSESRTYFTSRAWGTLGLGILLALILGLIARIPESDIVLIAAICCIWIRSSTRAAGLLLLGVLLVTIWLLLLILLLRLREGWGIVVLVLVIRDSAAAAVLLLLCKGVRGVIGV